MTFPTVSHVQYRPRATDEIQVAVPGDKPIETIRLTDDQKQRLVKQVNDHYHKPVPKERRDLRVPYFTRSAIVTILHPNGTLTRHSVLPRNLSRGGISFMVGRFIYPDCEAQVILPRRAGEHATIAGRTLRCNHFSGMIHECAVVFDEPIDLDLFVSTDKGEGESGAGGVTGKATAGSAGDKQKEAAPLVLVTEDVKNDRRLYKLWMEKLGFDVLEAESFEESLGVLKKKPVELVIVNACVGGDQGLFMVKRLRMDKFQGPILVVAHEAEETMRSQAREAGADEYLHKPFDQIDLRHAIERMMSGADEPQNDGRAIHSELAGNESMKPLLREFVGGIDKTVDQLTRAQAAEDIEALTNICRKLKGSGSGYGFPQITQLSLLVLDQLDMEQHDIDQLRASVEELTTILKRVKAD